ncbi:hypothetical protein KQX54_012243 [Cotesia glomerata]|uniref:BEN domain-containing protein n=1 Tax=Cotesia glomerata TaxID=32391 RepID=A0AAV7I4F6_COTGL|nr:hypothetical protein KQX54_012243 [Cotesia glomerata]
MFYLIECDKDQSLCTVEDFEIVCDPDQPPILDENVDFFYGKEKYKGVVVGMSEDANLLNEKAKNLKRKRKASGSPVQSSPLPPKRSRKPKKSFSFTDEISDCQVKKPKKNSDKKNQENYTKNLQNQVKSKIHDGNKDSRTETSKQQSAVNKPVADRPAISPTKKELRMMLERQNKLLELYQSPSRQSSALSSKILQKRNESDSEDSDKEVLRAETSSASDNDDYKEPLRVSKKETLEENDNQNGHQSESKTESNSPKDDTTLNPQLWGKNCGEPVVLLKNNIYCKKAIFDDAEDLSRKSATSLLRRLMDGVFRPDVILNLNCTYSGRPPSAQGKDKQLKKVEPLDRLAKRALMEYCDDYATKKDGQNPTRVIYVQLCHNGSVS